LTQQLGKRVLASILLMAVTLGALWTGSPAWPLLVAIVGCAMSWEWARLVGRGRFGAAGWIASAGPLAATLVLAFEGDCRIAVGILVLAAAGAAAVRARDVPTPRWLIAAGVLYVGVPSLALVWLRADASAGFATCLWLLTLVWAVDTGAYFAGRAIGGPKLAPRISPNKTWAGMVGGCVGAAVVGLVAAIWAGADGWVLALLGIGLAFVEQGGDLAESALKRHFGVKDSSALIPGHGGVLDRVDGLVAVAAAVALIALALGRSPLAT